MKEVWRTLYNNSDYRISSLGNIVRKRKTIKCNYKGKPHTRVLKEKKIATHINKNKYRYTNIAGKTCTVHRLLAFAFIKNDDPKNKTNINHKDGDRSNNSLDNLEWVTYSENSQHAYNNELRTGTLGENTKSAKLSTDDVLSIKWMLENKNMTQQEIADNFNITRSVISAIKRGVSWDYITGYEYQGRTKKFKGKVRNYVKK